MMFADNVQDSSRVSHNCSVRRCLYDNVLPWKDAAWQLADIRHENLQCGVNSAL